MEQKLIEFLKTELHYAHVYMKKELDTSKKNDIAWYARQRGLGATQFANALGMEFNKVEAIFDWYVGELEMMKNERD